MKHLQLRMERKKKVGPFIDRNGTYQITIRWVRLSSLGGSILHRRWQLLKLEAKRHNSEAKQLREDAEFLEKEEPE